MTSHYERHRNALIPQAEDFANAKVPPNIPERSAESGQHNPSWSGEDGNKWSGVFHAEMNRLWASRG